MVAVTRFSVTASRSRDEEEAQRSYELQTDAGPFARPKRDEDNRSELSPLTHAEPSEPEEPK
jgi:hypothetical protein